MVRSSLAGVKRNLWIVPILGVGIAAAVAIGLATNNPAAGVAVYAATVGTTVLFMNLSTAAVDRADLRIVASLDNNGSMLTLRLANVGRRPVRIERAGLAASREAETRAFPLWSSWERGPDRRPPPDFPIDLEETKSAERWTGIRVVSRWYVDQPVPRWLFVEDSKGERTWLALPPDIVRTLDDARPQALVDRDAEEAKKAAAAAEKAAREAKVGTDT